MTGYSYTYSKVSAPQVIEQIRRVGTPAFVYRESLPEISLEELGAETPALSPKGRAFGPDAEVRWQQEGPDFYALLILTETPEWSGSDGKGTAFETRTTVTNDHGEPEPLRSYLLGAWQPEEQAWIEVRIPHPLRYPVDGPSEGMARPALATIEYVKHGMVQYMRYTGFEVVPIEGD
jgi:hypothetical protein